MTAAVCSCVLALFQAWTIGLHSIRRIAIDNQIEVAVGIAVCLHSVLYIYLYSALFALHTLIHAALVALCSILEIEFS
jgi:hypothetical protein